MKNNKQPDDPKYIKELTQPTPSGIAKLLAAWNGLSIETQILILSKLNGINAPYLAEKVRINALDSENAYIRYLAATQYLAASKYAKETDWWFSELCSDEQKLIIEKIANDPVPLVKYSLWEDSSYFGSRNSKLLDDADTFFLFPHEARLAIMRTLDGDGKRVAALLSQAADKHLKDGRVSEKELYEILADYLGSARFQWRYVDAPLSVVDYEGYQRGTDIESLWKLVPKLPNGPAHVLITNLPEAAGITHEIPKDATDSMTDDQLASLLYRKDIRAKELRRKLFWEAGKDRDRIKAAAVSSNFKMEYDEFAKILEKPPRERLAILEILADTASQLPLCLYDAIHDALRAPDLRPLDWDSLVFGSARESIERRVNELEEWDREKQLTELRLYRLAHRAVPPDSKYEGTAPSEELEFLSEMVVPGDTWATFMAFSKEWPKRPPMITNLDEYFPEIYEIEGCGKEHATEANSNADSQAEVFQAALRKLESSLNQHLAYAIIVLVTWLVIVRLW